MMKRYYKMEDDTEAIDGEEAKTENGSDTNHERHSNLRQLAQQALREESTQ